MELDRASLAAVLQAEKPLCSRDTLTLLLTLCRTMDLLKQIRHCDALPPGMRKEARLAVKAMNRTPISDLVA